MATVTIIFFHNITPSQPEIMFCPKRLPALMRSAALSPSHRARLLLPLHPSPGGLSCDQPMRMARPARARSGAKNVPPPRHLVDLTAEPAPREILRARNRAREEEAQAAMSRSRQTLRTLRDNEGMGRAIIIAAAELEPQPQRARSSITNTPVASRFLSAFMQRRRLSMNSEYPQRGGPVRFEQPPPAGSVHPEHPPRGSAHSQQPPSRACIAPTRRYRVCIAAVLPPAEVFTAPASPGTVGRPVARDAAWATAGGME